MKSGDTSRTKPAVESAEIAGDWLNTLDKLTDGKFSDDPIAQLVKAVVFTQKKKPDLSEQVWVSARCYSEVERLKLITGTITADLLPGVLDALRWLDVEAATQRELDAKMHEAVCNGDTKALYRAARALEHYRTNGATPLHRRRAALLALAAGLQLQQSSEHPTLRKVCRYLKGKQIDIADSRAVRHECKELGLKLARESSARKGKHWRGIHKEKQKMPDEKLPPAVTFKAFHRVLSEPSDE